MEAIYNTFYGRKTADVVEPAGVAQD
ncbi:hypothetical protein M6B38_107170 [Iris pallida]|uniref:Uncharacterized protein n=1 Tax=Iris pallida TaxID=29817 RepID=A0AAX6ERK2_IRIPA|nr:hypothetical protein M6B38_107170 [Iris pallida]